MKKTFKLLIALGCIGLLATCSDDDDKLFSTMTSTIDLSASTLADHQANTNLLFSIDGGVTWDNYMRAKEGQKYKVMILDHDLEHVLTSEDFWSFDWSQSNPKPSDPTSDSPEFTLSSGDNKLHVVVTNTHCEYDGPSWEGNWIGNENPLPGECNCNSNDPNTITMDSSDPHKLTMDNYWGDGVGNATVFMIFSASTSAFDQTVTIPEQTTEEGGIATGEGTYDQCTGTFTLVAHYDIGGDLYTWEYVFTRP